MVIKVNTAYELGQQIKEKGIEGKVVRIDISVYDEDIQDIEYVLDNGDKILMGLKKS